MKDPRKPIPRMNAVRRKLESGLMPVQHEPAVALLHRGGDFLAWGTAADAPRVQGLRPCFEDLAEWISRRMDETGWSSEARRKAGAP